HDIQSRALRRRGLDGVCQSRGDRRLAFWLDPVEQLPLRCRGEFSRLCQDLTIGAVGRLAMAKDDDPEGKTVAISANGFAELCPDRRELAYAADLGSHALRGV